MSGTSERWQRVEALCERALSLDPSERRAFLASACGSDEDLRLEVESLVANDLKAEGFLGSRILEAVAHDVMSAPPAVLTGRRLGPYEINSRIGAGGMGEVYRARDTKLGRDVAIKVLPSDLLADGERLARFEREARTLALLNHPHIGAIYGVADADGIGALVLELIEGETLAAALARKPLPLERALRLAIQIAEALDHAHRRGITHRDLKPSNVMLTKAGAKLLDFGLARWTRPAFAAQSSITGDRRSLTGEGTILGTLNYMSPEQLEGRDADARSDLFAFGVLLYEMVTGRKAFDGPSQARVIAAILTSQPPTPSSIGPLVPVRLDRVIQKCLAKDPDARWQSARDLADELIWIAEDAARPVSSPADRAATTLTGRRGLSLAVVLAAAFAVIAGLAWTAWRLESHESPTSRAITRFVVEPSAGVTMGGGFDISPDGSQLAYAAKPSGGPWRLYLRRPDQFEGVAVAGTEGAGGPFFSPDGRWLGFFSGGKLLKIDARAAASPLVLCTGVDMGGLNGATWLADNSIVFTGREHGLRRVSAEGGEPTALTSLEGNPPEIDHHTPEPLPGGHTILFTVHEGAERFSVVAFSLDSGQRKTLLSSGFDARYSPSGHLVYASGSAILAVPFDANHLETTGAPVTLVEHVATRPKDGYGAFSLSQSGSLVFEPEQSIAGRVLAWADRSGAETPLSISARSFRNPRVSPDGRLIAFSATDRDRVDIWLYELASDKLIRATHEGANRAPLWTHDGRWLTYAGNRAGTQHVFWQPADGSGPPASLISSRNTLLPLAWAPDDRTLIYTDAPPTDLNQLFALDLDGDRRSPRLIHGSQSERPSLSPDGRWLAYQSYDSGRGEVYVEPFPIATVRHQVTVEGGREPIWSHNGRELFYRSGPRVLVIAVDTAHGFAAGKPRLLFEHPYVIDHANGVDYDLAPDGRFLMMKPSEEEQAPPRLNVVLNWVDELTHRVPSGR